MPRLKLNRDARQGEGDPEVLAPGARDELGTLRDILLGTLRHDYGQALLSLEQRLVTEASELRAELDQLASRLEGRIAELDARVTKDRDDLREHVSTQKSDLTSAIEHRSEQVVRHVDEGLAELKQRKVDRQRFSAFLNGVSSHLDADHGVSATTAPAPRVAAPPVAKRLATKSPPERRAPRKRGKPTALKPLGLGRPPWHPVDR